MRWRAASAPAFLTLVLLSACKHSASAAADSNGHADGGSEETEHPDISAASAQRCGECHGGIQQEWDTSAHAHAERSEVFRTMSANARDGRCEGCHAPLARRVDARSPLRGEGVTCDACHLMRDARVERSGAAFVLQTIDNTRYSTLCDAKNHYFHKVGCLPLFGESRQCGTCHLLYEPVDGGTDVPVFTEYEEWEKSSFGSIGVVCQDCHMPGTTNEVAVGAGRRQGVAHHTFIGPPDLREHAVSWSVTESGDDARIHVEVGLKNERAGHSVPTGMPGRRLILRVKVTSGGNAVDAAERVFARVLVDSGGVEVPFYRAVRVASDHRLAAGATETETFDLNAPKEGGEIEVDLVRAEMAPTVSAALGLPPPAETVVLSTRTTFGQAKAGSRDGLPKHVSATP